MLNFEEYERAGRLPVSKWIDELSPGNYEKAEKFMTVARRGNFGGSRFKKFQTNKKDPNLYEATWPGFQGVPHRIFCYPKGKGAVTVVLLCGFIHKGPEERKPKSAVDYAVQRCKEIAKKEATTHEFTLGQIEEQGG